MKHLTISLGFFFFILFADAQGKTQSFTSTGTYKFIVPKAVKSIKVVLWGACGWGGGGSNMTRGLTGSIVSSANGNIGGTGNNAGIDGKIIISWK